MSDGISDAEARDIVRELARRVAAGELGQTGVGPRYLTLEEQVAVCEEVGSLFEQLEAMTQDRDQIRSAWNAHMDRCETPTVEGVSDEDFFERIRQWRDAPSNTAGAGSSAECSTASNPASQPDVSERREAKEAPILEAGDTPSGPRSETSGPAIGPHETPGICAHIWKLLLNGKDFACIKCGAERSPASEPSS